MLKLLLPLLFVFVNSVHAQDYEDSRNVLIGGTALTLTLLATRNDSIEPLQREMSENKPLGDLADVGNLYGSFVPNLIFASYYGYFDLRDHEKLKHSKAYLMLQASVGALLITNAIKYTVHEPRPCDQCDDHSFPSGHTTNAFSFAGVILGLDYPWYVDGLALGFGALTGFSRINDNRHYAHDVAAGATIGLAVGLGLTEMFKRNTKEAGRFMILPVGDGAYASYNYGF